jgi:hypothetical protein
MLHERQRVAEGRHDHMKLESEDKLGGCEDISYCFRMLAEPVRFRILEILSFGEQTVYNLRDRVRESHPS